MTRRAQLEAAIDHALDLLDRMDGDPDLEAAPLEDQGDDELAMQWPTWNRAA